MKSLPKEVSLILLLGSSAFTLQGCRNDDGELYRNWAEKILPSFEDPPSSNTISFVIGDSGYFSTAYSTSSGACTKDFWAYNTRTKVWSQVACFPGTGQRCATAFAVKGKAYIVATKGECDVWEYDPYRNDWTK